MQLRSCYLVFVDSAKLMKKHIACKGKVKNVLQENLVTRANGMALRRWTIIDRNTNENGDVPNA